MSIGVKLRIYLFSTLFFLAGCGTQLPHSNYRIALDPTWQPLNVKGKEANIQGFTIDLIETIFETEREKISVYQTDASNLLGDLKARSCEAICSTLHPQLFHKHLYCFSDPYLITAPILVVPVELDSCSPDYWKEKTIGISKSSDRYLTFTKYPNAFIRLYRSPQQLLTATAKGELDGCIIDLFTASDYLQNFFKKQLKIGSSPLNNEGIRLVSLKNKKHDFLKAFDKGIVQLKQNGKYEQLKKKWSIPSLNEVETKSY